MVFRYHMVLRYVRDRRVRRLHFLDVVLHRKFFYFMHSDKAFSVNSACYLTPIAKMTAFSHRSVPHPLCDLHLHIFLSFRASGCLHYLLLYVLAQWYIFLRRLQEQLWDYSNIFLLKFFSQKPSRTLSSSAWSPSSSLSNYQRIRLCWIRVW